MSGLAWYVTVGIAIDVALYIARFVVKMAKKAKEQPQ